MGDLPFKTKLPVIARIFARYCCSLTVLGNMGRVLAFSGWAHSFPWQTKR